MIGRFRENVGRVEADGFQRQAVLAGGAQIIAQDACRLFHGAACHRACTEDVASHWQGAVQMLDFVETFGGVLRADDHRERSRADVDNGLFSRVGG